MRVLVVEDNLRLLNLIATHLSDAGLTVDTSSNAQQFRDICDNLKHTLYLIDLGLPDGDGIRLIQEARRSRRDTLILVVTGRQQIRDRVCALESGADDCLVKPFHVEELLARVKALLRRSHVPAPQRLRTGRLVLDCDTNEVFCGGRRVRAAAERTAAARPADPSLRASRRQRDDSVRP